MMTSSGLTVDLSLNIIAQPIAITKTAVTPHANKKTNKYERRRQRSNKIAKNTSIKNTAAAFGREINNKGNHGKVNVKNLQVCRSDESKLSKESIPLVEAAQGETSVDQSKSIATSTTTMPTKNSPNTAQEMQVVKVNTPESETSKEKLHGQTTRLTENIIQSKSDAVSEEVNAVSSDPSIVIELKEKGRQDVLTTTTLQRTSNKNRTNNNNHMSLQMMTDGLDVVPPTASQSTTATSADVDATTAARAAYMAEFHARPMELDRRAGIRNYNTTNMDIPTSNNNSDGMNNDLDNSTESETKWENLPLHTRLLSAIHQSIGTTSRPTTIQCQAISLLVQQQQQPEPKNIFIHSETGSGKTLAYLLPVLQAMMITTEPSSISPSSTTMTTGTTSTPTSNVKLSRLEYGTRCVIICPTRELAVQTSIVCERMCRAAGLMHIVSGCLGGSSSTSSSDNTNDSRSTEKIRLRKGLGIIVATPGRLLDHLKRTESLRMTIRQIQYMILDEVDRLLDSGLGQQVQEIIHIIQSLISTSVKNATSSPWRSVFVSATITEQVQTLARDILSSKDPSHKDHSSPPWIVVSGRKGDSAKVSAVQGKRDNTHGTALDDTSPNNTMESSMTSHSFAESSPKQLIHMHVTCSAKLRLTSLIAFLLDRTMKGETTVVFVSTCASVDYYHTLLTSMDCILPSPVTTNKNDTKSVQKGIFGKNCPIFKLHGNVPQNERQKVLNKFKEAAIAHKSMIGSGGGSVLFATDVAARGLNLPSVDWIVQFDVPCDVADYVHRAGRVARAGGVGRALLFLLPSEKDFLNVLQQRGIMNMSPMSLTLILNTAADICKPLTQQGILRGGGSLQKDTSKDKNSSRTGEAFCVELQFRLEDCVIQDDFSAKAVAKAAKKAKPSSREGVSGKLIDMARDAFLSYIRAYPTKEKSVRHIFAAKALHLGHVARSFALKEPPKKVVVASQTSRKRKLDKLEFSEDTSDNNKRKHLSFDKVKSKAKNGGTGGQGKKMLSTEDRFQQPANNGKGRSLLLANAAKLQSNGLDGL